jgi:hypothetical protein
MEQPSLDYSFNLTYKELKISFHDHLILQIFLNFCNPSIHSRDTIFLFLKIYEQLQMISSIKVVSHQLQNFIID